ncbi:MAG: hypothetical protein KJO43_08505 [Phycisphaerae bacterium]|nr:hypothetical protein [Phycisphaerae bacterium]
MNVNPNAALTLEALTANNANRGRPATQPIQADPTQPVPIESSNDPVNRAQLFANRPILKASTPPPPTEEIAINVPLTVEGLREAWGTADTNYDLDGDGVVDMKDLLMLLSKLQQPASEPDTTSPNPPGLEPNDDVTPAGEDTNEALSVKGLRAAWGSDDTRYDLDGDGVVGMRDLMQLLSQLRATPTDPANPVVPGTPTVDDGTGVNPNDTAIASEPTDEPLSLKGLQAAFGTDDASYDFDNDGTVTMRDLLHMLSRLGDHATAAGDTMMDDGDTRVMAGHDALVSLDSGAEPATPMSVQGLLDAWGTSGGEYDLVPDGVVDMQDLLSFLSRIDRGNPEWRSARAAIATAVPTGLATPPPNESAREQHERLQPIANAVRARLEASGFTNHPPQNIHALLQQLNLNGNDQRSVLGQLNQAYPGGLGLNIVG